MSTLYWDGTESETPTAESYSTWCLRLFIFFANENGEGEMSRQIKFILINGGMSEVLISAKCFWVLSSYHLTPLLPDVWRMFLHFNSLCSAKSKNPCVGMSIAVSNFLIEKHLSFSSGCGVHLTKFTDSASSFFSSFITFQSPHFLLHCSLYLSAHQEWFVKTKASEQGFPGWCQ